MIEVFKTNVREAGASMLLVQKLLEHYPKGRISFDLEDCDRILRIEQKDVCPVKVSAVLAELGYLCEVLED